MSLGDNAQFTVDIEIKQLVTDSGGPSATANCTIKIPVGEFALTAAIEKRNCPTFAMAEIFGLVAASMWMFCLQQHPTTSMHILLKGEAGEGSVATVTFVFVTPSTKDDRTRHTFSISFPAKSTDEARHYASVELHRRLAVSQRAVLQMLDAKDPTLNARIATILSGFSNQQKTLFWADAADSISSSW